MQPSRRVPEPEPVSALPVAGRTPKNCPSQSTTGRPRRTTDEAVKIILEWHAQYRAWKGQRPVPSLRQLARQLDLSSATVSDVIRNHGKFKQASPENRAAVQSEYSRRLRAINRDRDHEW